MKLDETLLPARTVLHTFGGISQMTLWRWVHDENMGFPQPIKIKRRNYFKASEIGAYRDQLAAFNEVAE